MTPTADPSALNSNIINRTGHIRPSSMWLIFYWKGSNLSPLLVVYRPGAAFPNTLYLVAFFNNNS